MKQPDRGHEGPLHVEDLRGARRARKVGHPEVNPNGKVGHVATREVVGKRGQKFPRGLKGLARGRVRRARGGRGKLGKQRREVG